jgi:Na+/proline symporter
LYANSGVAGPGGGIVYDAIIPAMLSNFSGFLIGVVIVLVFAASISTLSSLVMASASTLTMDFLKGNIIKKMSEKKQLVIIRVLIVVFIIISSCIAVIQYKGGISFIAQLMGVSWGALAGYFLAPFLYGLCWKRVTRPAVWCNFIFSTVIMILNIFFRNSFPAVLQSPINAGAFTMLAGLVVVPVVSILTKTPEKILVDRCFSCYEETVSVKIRDDLGN